VATVDWCVPRRAHFSVNSANQRSNRFNRDEKAGVKWRWKRGCRPSHLRMAGLLWVA
jgi:hypothetical protein